MEKLKKNWPIALLLLAIAGCMFILNIATMISPDDYSYARMVGGEDLKVTSFSEIFGASKALYLGWTGRIIPHILIGIFMTTSTIFLKIINTLLFIILLIYITKFITKQKSYIAIATAFAFLVYGKMFGEKFAWISRKLKLFVDNNSSDSVFVQFLWILCGKPSAKKLAKNCACNKWIFSWFFT